MKTDAVKENIGFFGKEFREDITLLSSLSEDKIISFTEFMKSLGRYEDFDKSELWVEFSIKIKEPLDNLAKYRKPLTFIAYTSIESKCSVNDILEDLVENNIIEHSKTQLFFNLITPIKELMQKAFERKAPKLPIPRFEGISSRCLLVSKFEEEISIEKHTLENYRPVVSQIYPLVTIKLSFKDDKDSPIGIQLTKDDLDTMIKSLQLIQKQIETVSDLIKEHNLPIIINNY